MGGGWLDGVTVMAGWIMLGFVMLGFTLLVCAVALYDLLQRRHSILRTFPVVGHLRFLLEDVGPELRQYIVTGNDEERPFSRDQRRWVYATAKQDNANTGFGTANDLELSANYLIIKPAAFPLPGPAATDNLLACQKVLGAARGRPHALRPPSVVNVSGMSFGALSAPATTALNQGCAMAGCLHNTGEGGISEHHLHGGDLIFQIGTGYFGCRTVDGRFSLERLVDLAARHPIRAVEIKLSQGAKPGLGGILPAAKVTPEIARIRGVKAGEVCYSPSTHTAFGDVDSMLDVVEEIAAATGLPVGIKSAVGEATFWKQLARQMAATDRGVDFITVDGGEGGSGAAPLAFSDHVALPFKIGFSRVHRVFVEAGLDDRIVFVGSAKLGFPETALLAMAMGCDLINVGREAMLALGCIQAQRCHTDRCPTGVATQSRWLTRGLDPRDKSARVANYVRGLRHELLRLAHSCAVTHPALVTLDSFEILDGHFGSRPAREVFGDNGKRWT